MVCDSRKRDIETLNFESCLQSSARSRRLVCTTVRTNKTNTIFNLQLKWYLRVPYRQYYGTVVIPGKDTARYRYPGTVV